MSSSSSRSMTRYLSCPSRPVYRRTRLELRCSSLLPSHHDQRRIISAGRETARAAIRMRDLEDASDWAWRRKMLYLIVCPAASYQALCEQTPWCHVCLGIIRAEGTGVYGEAKRIRYNDVHETLYNRILRPLTSPSVSLRLPASPCVSVPLHFECK